MYIYIFMRYILLGVLTWFAFGLKEVLKHNCSSPTMTSLQFPVHLTVVEVDPIPQLRPQLVGILLWASGMLPHYG